MAVQALRLSSEAQVEDLLAATDAEPVLIFKHSATCPVSRRAMNEFRQFLNAERPTKFTAAYLIVQEDRPVAKAVADRLKVRHESPQAILVQGGKVLWHASHRQVTATALAAALDS